MNAENLMQTLFDWCQSAPELYTNTCDTLKCGDPQRELHQVGVTMFPTPEVIRAAHAWGADLLIVHEPLFYEHFEKKAPGDPVIAAKEALLEQTGLTIWRFHDHPHHKNPDMICEGELQYIGLPGTFLGNRYFGVNRYELATPLTARQLAAHIEKVLHTPHVRIAGTLDKPCTKLSLAFGTPGHNIEELRDPEVEILISGETSEWSIAQYAREADQLGFCKAQLVLGHIPSERDGMKLLTQWMQKQFPELTTQYFECGEVYTYQDLA